MGNGKWVMGKTSHPEWTLRCEVDRLSFLMNCLLFFDEQLLLFDELRIIIDKLFLQYLRSDETNSADDLSSLR